MFNPVKKIEPKQALTLLIERLIEDFNSFSINVCSYGGPETTLGLVLIMKEMLEDIKTLKKMQIISFEELESVKTIIKLEQFASKKKFSNHFRLCFPNYKSFIRHDLFLHALIDIHLDNLTHKYEAFIRCGHDLEAEKIQSILLDIKKLNDEYFTRHEINSDQYQKAALKIINDSRPLLEQHRGYKKILGNLALLIATMGTAFLINKCYTGHFLFFKQTESAKLLQSLTNDVVLTSNYHLKMTK